MIDLLILVVVAAAAAAIGVWLGMVLIARPIDRAIERADQHREAAPMEDANDRPAPED